MSDTEKTLSDAIIRRDIKTTKHIIKHVMPISNININHADRYGNTFLHQAGYFKFATIIKYLIDHGADVNAVNDMGQTPLHYLQRSEPVWNYSEETDIVAIAKCLINHGIDVNAIDDYGDTCLHAAAKNGNLDMVKYLLDSGVNKDHIDKNGYTGADIASGHGNSKMAKYIESYGYTLTKRA
jgi:ankyrin repeat protein